MFKNRKFGFYAVTLCVTGLLYTFICAGLESGQTQIIRAVITPAGGGWTAEKIQLPMTVGSFLAVPLAFLCCTGFLRAGIRQTLIPCAAAAALGCVGLVCANGLDIYGGAASGQYGLFFAALLTMECACVMVRMALALLCLQWFCRFRGRALGAVAMGAPLFSAVGAAALAHFVQTTLQGDYRPLYVAVAAALGLLALSTRFLLRDRPEEAGLYPDGDGYAPAGEPAEPEPPMTLSRILRDRRTWQLLLAMGALAAAAAGWFGFLEDRLLTKGGGGPTLLGRASPWLALGAILGIPASYVFGWLCDRLSVSWTSVLLGLAEMGAVYLLWHFPKEVALWTEGVPLSLSVGLLMGGVPTVVPCAVGHVFGRQQAISACRAVFPGLLLLAALTGPAGTLLGGGARARLYAVLFCLAALGALASLFLRPPRKTPPEK